MAHPPLQTQSQENWPLAALQWGFSSLGAAFMGYKRLMLSPCWRSSLQMRQMNKGPILPDSLVPMRLQSSPKGSEQGLPSRGWASTIVPASQSAAHPPPTGTATAGLEKWRGSRCTTPFLWRAEAVTTLSKQHPRGGGGGQHTAAQRTGSPGLCGGVWASAQKPGGFGHAKGLVLSDDFGGGSYVCVCSCWIMYSCDKRAPELPSVMGGTGKALMVNMPILAYWKKASLWR